MNNIYIDFSEKTGVVKPMHAVNNGPVYKFSADQRITNIDTYREAGIPYARTHDASFYATYGGEHTVDISAVFPDFNADPYSADSYDFVITDEYLKVIEYAGTEVFYRLGSKIEHWKKKYGTLPPKDFQKWAVVCEHIIRHYTEGWADGFKMNINYWEIWNEPDLDPDDSTHKRTWGGTKLQFFDLFEVAAKHLKSCFPHLKIGGPALSGNLEWGEDFLTEMQRRNVPIDFFSWHCYGYEPDYVAEKAEAVRAILDKCGYKDTESINNEWNYVRDWVGDAWVYSLKSEKSLKGASFIAGTMCVGQYSSMDMLMYYDARPSAMNGMFNTDMVCETLKGYYPFKMFNELYKLKNAVKVDCDKDLYACAATDGDKSAIMLTHFNENDDTEAKEIRLNVSGYEALSELKVKYFVLDESNDLTLCREEVFTGNQFTAILSVPLYGSYLVLIEK